MHFIMHFVKHYVMHYVIHYVMQYVIQYVMRLPAESIHMLAELQKRQEAAYSTPA